MPENDTKDSILQSTKKMLGLEPDNDGFDLDIVTHINSAFSTLYQAGVGPIAGYQIDDASNKWSEFVGDRMDINNVKSYIYLQVRYDFDPPANSFGQTAVKDRVQELIWRLNVAADFTIDGQILQ